MDDSLLAEFHSVFSVTGDVNAPTRPHPAFSSLYKQRGARHGEQEARRRRLLADQRVRRRDRADCVRRIAEGEEWEEEMEEEEEKEKEGDQVDSPPVGGVSSYMGALRNPYSLCTCIAIESGHQWGRNSVLISEVEAHARVVHIYLGREKVSCLERCPQFRSVLIERERRFTLHIYIHRRRR